ncbi:MAG: hypothetical protein OHK0029_20060 [Armatimonadaceae bacterium]
MELSGYDPHYINRYCTNSMIGFFTILMSPNLKNEAKSTLYQLTQTAAEEGVSFLEQARRRGTRLSQPPMCSTPPCFSAKLSPY